MKILLKPISTNPDRMHPGMRVPQNTSTVSSGIVKAIPTDVLKRFDAFPCRLQASERNLLSAEDIAVAAAVAVATAA